MKGGDFLYNDYYYYFFFFFKILDICSFFFSMFFVCCLTFNGMYTKENKLEDGGEREVIHMK